MADSVHSETFRILLVNDSVLFLQALKRFLKGYQAAFEIDMAEGSSDALERARRLQPHLVILDVNMPQVGGLELLPQLRATVPGARIVVVTFHADEHIRQTALGLGADGFVSKTRLTEELLPVIWSLFPHTKVRAA